MFKDIRNWSEDEDISQRTVWTECSGMPPYLWSHHNIRKIGETWCRVIDQLNRDDNLEGLYFELDTTNTQVVGTHEKEIEDNIVEGIENESLSVEKGEFFNSLAQTQVVSKAENALDVMVLECTIKPLEEVTQSYDWILLI